MSRTQKLNQSGMVSIIVTMIMMIVISLIVLGFSQVARRNQREALDRQLSSQAYYAAETGINDVLDRIANGGSFKYSYLTDGKDYNDCSDPASPNNFMVVHGLTTKAKLGTAAENIGYTCLLVTPHLNPVTATVNLGSNQVVHLKPDAAVFNGKLIFTWQAGNSGPTTSVAGCPSNTAINKFTPQTDWTGSCSFGILRADVFDATNPPKSSDGADALSAETAGIYFVPTTAATAPLTPVTNGAPTIVKASCTATLCTAKVQLSGTFADMYIRANAIYAGLGTVSVATSDGSTFSGAGVKIDSTGKAQDVLRRVQVQIPVGSNNGLDVPAYALSSASAICKRFGIQGPTDNANPDYTAASTASTGPLCTN